LRTVDSTAAHRFRFSLKAQAGLEDFRVQSYETVDKYLVVVHLARVYVEHRFAQERSAQVGTCGAVIRRHRDEHAIDWLAGAIQMALRPAMLKRFSGVSCAWKPNRLGP